MRAPAVVPLLAAALAAPAGASAAIELHPVASFGYDPSGACAPSNGITVSVTAELPEGTPKAKARALKRKYAPRHASLRLAGTTWTVKIDRHGGYVTDIQVGWGF